MGGGPWPPHKEVLDFEQQQDPVFELGSGVCSQKNRAEDCSDYALEAPCCLLRLGVSEIITFTQWQLF